ncbi:MAG TPA: lipoprotein [Vicinamibacterales bacterium]|nr:lipoprotein [Vicinamibacterales bacterium]
MWVSPSWADDWRDRRRRRRAAIALLLAATLGLAGCGKKGPPRAPLRLVPEAPADVSARRIGDRVYLRFRIPAKNAGAPGAAAIDRVDVYAVTVAPGGGTPPNGVLYDRAHRVGSIAVKPAPEAGAPTEPAAGEPPDTRPAPGDTTSFAEELTPAVLEPIALPKTSQGAPAAATSPAAPPAAASGTQTTAPASATPPASATAPASATPPASATTPASPTASPSPQTPAPPAAPTPGVLTRVYVIRGEAHGRPGTASARILLPLTAPPGAPTALDAGFTERAVTLKWQAPKAQTGVAFAYNVYPASARASATEAPVPINPAPLTATSFAHTGAPIGQEQCFVVRAVVSQPPVTLEGSPSDPACVTPRDIFPPAAPKGLSTVAGPGAINLIWDANVEPDLGGYIVLRGEAGGALQPLTPSPIRETTYRDAAVTPGNRYVYAIVAVDRASPPNRSAPSARVEETAR